MYQRVSSLPSARPQTSTNRHPTRSSHEEDLDTTESARGFAGTPGMAAAFLLAMAAGATAAAYVFRADLAAIIAAWQQAP